MRKLACVLTGMLLVAAATPAKAQYFYGDPDAPFVGDTGVSAYRSAYASSWWGGPGGYYAYSGVPGYAYSGWWGGGAYAMAPGYGAGLRCICSSTRVPDDAGPASAA